LVEAFNARVLVIPVLTDGADMPREIQSAGRACGIGTVPFRCPGWWPPDGGGICLTGAVSAGASLPFVYDFDPAPVKRRGVSPA
jgi:hypothetical protein